MVTKREVLEELTLPKLKKIATKMGIQVNTGITGFLGKQFLGVEPRMPYIDALANSKIVTLEAIDHILGTNLSGVGLPPTEPKEKLPSPALAEPTTGESPSPSRNLPPDPIGYIVEGWLQKEWLQNISENLNLPVSGTKAELIQRIIASPGFEPKMLLWPIYKAELRVICEEWGLPTEGTVDELRGRIAGVLEEGLRRGAIPSQATGRGVARPPRRGPGPERVQNAPKDDDKEDTVEDILQFILDRYLYKDQVQDMGDELGLPVSGTKEDLIARILGEDDFTPEMAMEYVDKEGLKDLCEILELRTTGTREDLEGRVLNFIETMEESEEAKSTQEVRPSAPVPASPARLVPTSDQRVLRRDLFIPEDSAAQPPLQFPEAPSPTLIPEPHAPQVAQLQMVAEFLQSYVPSKRFRNEQAYEIEVAQAMRHQFGTENVKTQANIYGGRIDIEVLGIGVEIKVPANRTQLQTLLGQVSIYRNYYGPNLMVVIFNDLCKVQDVTEFQNVLLGRGVQVFVK